MQTALFGLERSVYTRIARLVHEDMLTRPSVAKTARR